MSISTFFRAFITSAALLLAVGIVQQARAQLPGSGGPTSQDPNPTTPTTEVPIDGGASLVLAAGVGYGLRKLRQRRRN